MLTESLSSGFEPNFASSRTIPFPSIRFELVKGAVCYLALETFCAWVGEAGFEFPGEAGAPCSVPFPSGLTCANEPGSFGSSTTASSSPGPLQPGGDPRAAEGRSPRSLRAAEGRWPLPPGSASPPASSGPAPARPCPWAGERLGMTRPGALEAHEASCILGCIKGSVASSQGKLFFCPTPILCDPTWSTALSSECPV